MTALADLCLLVVDDDPDSQILFTWILESEGAKVVTASSAGEALDLLDTVQPDMLLSDIAMPAMNGYTLIQQIRQRELVAGKALPAIAVTAVVGEEARQRALVAGFQAHLPKPIEPVELVAAIARLIKPTPLTVAA